MRTGLFAMIIAVAVAVATGCSQVTTARDVVRQSSAGGRPALAADTFTFNLPCRVINIHPELPGEAVLFLWLHGGVHDKKIHSYWTHPNHWDNCAADDSIIGYLRRHNIKAVALLPMCHRADRDGCIAWRDCWDDVKVMIDDLVSRGLVDPKRVYLAGSSDGGRGTWDYAAEHPEVFAAAISMSCSEPRMVSIPVYFFGTASEMDCSQRVEELRREGATIARYEYCKEFRHGGDAARCDDALLTEFFGHTAR